MARAKKGAALTPEERLQAALVPDWEWPYKLPENWCWTNWGECGEFVAGSGFKNEYQGFTNYDIPFYKVSSLKTANETGYLCDNTNTVDETVRKKLKAALIPANSLLFAKIGEAIRLNRRAINTVPCCVDNNMMAFIPIICQLKYAFYWSKGIDLYDFTNATTVPAIRKTDLEKISFPLAPLAEQQRIVDRIESLFAKLDEAKEKAQAVVDSFETRKAAILHKAFTGELTAKWREDHGVRMESWGKRLLSTVSSLQTGLMKGKKYTGKTVELPYLRVANVQDGFLRLDEIKKIDVEEKAISRYSLAVGDVLFTEGGDFDKLGRGTVWEGQIKNCLHQNHIFVVRPNPEVLNPYFLSYQAGSRYGKAYFLSCSKQTTNLASINSTQLKNFPVLIPSIAEQEMIIKLINSFLEKELHAKEVADAVLAQIDLMKKSILARAFRGELGTNDPSEESAVELLKKVFQKE